MNRILTITILASLTLTSCNTTQKNDLVKENQTNIDGFWERVGTIKIANGIAVDTIYYADNPETEDYKQIKAFVDGKVIWLHNRSDTINYPWVGGNGGYGRFDLESKKSLTEKLYNGTGWFGSYVKLLKDSLNIEHTTFNFVTDLKEDSFTQLMNNQTDGTFMEYFHKIKPSNKKSSLDGAWKRVYEISYVNGIPVDTISVASDVVVDVKIMKNGHYLYQVDQTGLYNEDEAQYGGFGGYGQFDYDEKKGLLVEYLQTNSGNNVPVNHEPKTLVRMNDTMTNFNYADIKFYNKDMFLQVTKDTLEQMSIGRGLVYKRIK